jgi:hypothetical protein
VRTLSKDMERLGLITDGGFDLESLSERVEQYVATSNSVVVGRSEIGAWCRTECP